MLKLILAFFLFFSSLNAYESEDKLKVVIIAKVAKFIKWENKDYDNFIITVLNNPYGDLFDKTLHRKKIKNKTIEIKYIDDIDSLSDTNILYISTSDAKQLTTVLDKTKDKNILTVSDIRGFTDKDGIMQIYFSSQKVKLRINLKTATKENLKINSSLLRIADVIRGE
ncbi:MAG: YfiR family protein [Campylobacterota bacterium]|nr:YfiR family protein [Campylobacterota bacterium]